MARVVHFEIHADDPERAIRFYQNLFGWHIQKWDGPMEYWMVVTGKDPEPGINGGLMRRHGPPPTAGQAVSSHVCTVQIADIEACLKQIPAEGGEIALPRMPIPGYGWLAYGKDTEGNLFGVMQPDANAK
jgi:predicted enzyme related to lactoylglutathione lyase